MTTTPISSAAMLNRKEVKRLRKALGLSFRRAAVKAGWTHAEGARWQRLENGTPADPSLSTVEAVARALDCTVNDLLSVTPKTKRKT
jgi:transcriptional regulator with XRE-family HTH domain